MEHADGTVTRLVTAILARNEAAPDRYLARVIQRCQEFSDDVLVLDDNSTDDTYQVAWEHGCHVAKRHADTAAWGAEAPARAQLWDIAANLAGDDGWVLVCDADMELRGDPRPLTLSWEVGAWAFPLVDMWGDDVFRVDGPWGHGPRTPRPWLFRPSALREPPVWPDRGIHCGHAPSNFLQHVPCGIAPPDVFWLHWGWAQREHRVAKHAAYMAQAAQLTPFELQHAESILD